MFLKCEQGCHLTTAEQLAIDYINENENIIAELTITDIARLAYVSPLAVSRAIRKCGVMNMTDMRCKLAAGEVTKKNFVVNEILDKSYMDCVKTIERIDTAAILKVIELIHSARIIHVLAGGTTRLVAEEFEFQLQSQGYNAYLQCDSGVMKRMEGLVTSEDLVIIFTVRNDTPDLIIGAETVKKQGGTLVVCCCEEGTTLEQFADIMIYGYSQRIYPKRGFDTTSRLGLQVIVRTIVEYLALE